MLIANWNNKATGSHVLDESTSNGASDLELFAEDGSGDAKDLRNFLDHSFVLLLVEEDGVVKLLLNLGLGPGLLLGLGTLGALTLCSLRILGRGLAGILTRDLLLLSLYINKQLVAIF